MTGAGAGIGLAAVRAFLDAGAMGVAMLYNSNEKTIQTAKDLEQEFGGKTKVLAYKCPVHESKTVKDVVEKIIADFGRLDVFVSLTGSELAGD